MGEIIWISIVFALASAGLIFFIDRTGRNRSRAALDAQRDQYEQFLTRERETAAALQQRLDERQSEIQTLVSQRSQLSEQNRALEEKLSGQKQQMDEAKRQMQTEFENIAAKILEDKSRKFTDLNRENLSGILKPLGEHLEKFHRQVNDVYDKESKERFSLAKEVEKLVRQTQASEEITRNLTNALRANPKVQGDWGEMILENILEHSGLQRDREYFVQHTLRDDTGATLKSEQGRIMRPDVVVNLPDERKVVIDSKVSLTAYVSYVEAEGTDQQGIFLKRHLDSVRQHIDELAGKSYPDYAGALDYVLMFVPNEPAYILTMNSDKELWAYAFKHRVVMISPTNLIVSLRLISDLWKRDRQNRNVQKIAERGRMLYDKLAGFVETMGRLGDSIRRTHAAYDEAMNQLREGRGNLVDHAEKLRALGLNPKKRLKAAAGAEEIEDDEPEELLPEEEYAADE